MKKYKLAIFDLDGTLLDTSFGLISAFQKTLKKYNLPIYNDDFLKSAIGPPFFFFLKENYSELTDTEAREITNDFRNLYMQDDFLLKAIPYKGIYETWDLLTDAEIGLAVATNKREDYAVRLLSHFGFNRYTNYLYGTDFDNRTGKKEVIQRCLESAATDGREALMIGDTSNDAESADVLQIDFVGVTYGFGFRRQEQMNNYKTALGVVNTPQEILKFVLEEK